METEQLTYSNPPRKHLQLGNLSTGPIHPEESQAGPQRCVAARHAACAVARSLPRARGGAGRNSDSAARYWRTGGRAYTTWKKASKWQKRFLRKIFFIHV